MQAWVATAALAVIIAGAASIAPGTAHAVEIARFASSRGDVRLNEDQGRALLAFEGGDRVNLPPNWQQTTVEHVYPLRNQDTAVVVAFADNACGARQALMVVTPQKVWGPYALGGCEETLAYQISSDRNAFVAVRPASNGSQAWVYTSDDHYFRGPAAVRLPDSLARLTNNPSPPPQVLPGTPSPMPRSVAPAEADTVVSETRAARTPPAARPPASPAAVPPARDIPPTKALASRVDAQATALPRSEPVAMPPKSTRFSPDDASLITNQVKGTIKPQVRVSLDLS